MLNLLLPEKSLVELAMPPFKSFLYVALLVTVIRSQSSALQTINRSPVTIPAQGSCKKDVLIIYDLSHTIGKKKKDFRRRVLPFLSSFINKPRLNVNAAGTNFALLTFSSTQKTSVQFNFNGVTQDATQLIKYLRDSIDYNTLSDVNKRPDEALKKANAEVFFARNTLNARPDAADVVLLVTDGAPSRQSASAGRTARRYARDLKSKGIEIIAAMVGEKRRYKKNRRRVEKMASSPQHVFDVGGTSSDAIVNQLVDKLCFGGSVDTSPPPSSPAGPPSSDPPESSLSQSATRPLPSLDDFAGDASGALNGSFAAGDQCTAEVTRLDSIYLLKTNPQGCLNLAVLLARILPAENGNFDMESGDFMVLDDILIRSLSYNTATRAVEIAAAYNGSLSIIPGLVSISNVRLEFSFSSSHPAAWQLYLTSSITIGTVPINVKLVRNQLGYFLSASSDVSLNVSDIANLFQTGDSFLPDTSFTSNLTNAKFNVFNIGYPRVKAAFTDGYGFLFGGKIRILDWEPFDVAVVINKVNDEPLAVTIAVFTQSFSISRMFRDLFNVDISDVPLIGQVDMRNLGLLISTRHVANPLILVDVAPSGVFTLPYRQGIQFTFEILIIDVYVKVDVILSTSLLSLTVSQPGQLTIGKVIESFLPDESSNYVDNGTLRNWPKFLPDPLQISLTKFNVAAAKGSKGWQLSNLEVNLRLLKPLVLFDDVITISNLQFNFGWGKTGNNSGIRGLIAGTVTIGNSEIVSPRVDIRIPFPFKNTEITFTFKEFSINNIAKAFNFTIPNNTFTDLLTQLQLDRIAIAFNAAGKLNRVSVQASIPHKWNLFGSFSIGNVKLSFEVDNIANSGSRTWAFKIGGEISISSCTIYISATLGSDLIKIEANGTNCAVSIRDILEAINLNPSILPSLITGFTLSEPAFSFTYDRVRNAKSIGFGATTSLFKSSDVEVALVSSGGKTAVVAAFAVRTASDVPVLGFLSDLGLSDIAIIFVSRRMALTPYEWNKPVFNNYLPTTQVAPTGLKIVAQFTPSDNNMMGKLLKQAGKARIKVELSLPELIFKIDLDLSQLPGGGVPMGSRGRFVGMGLVISKQLIGLNLRFRLDMDDVRLMFRGDLTFSFGGTVTISLLMEGVWNNPLGIPRFSIYRLGLALGINLATLLPSFGLTGAIGVTPVGQTQINASITICVDTSDPSKTVFELHFTRFLLKDIVNLFTSDNNEIVLPDKLGNTGFTDEVRIFVSPAGNDLCFGKAYPAGVAIKGSFAIPFLQISASVDIEIGLKPFSLRANMSMQPINYGNGLLRIQHARDSSRGPYLRMNIGTSAFMISGSCKVVLFGASISIHLEISKTKLFFEGELNLWNLFRVYLKVDLSLTGSPHLHIVGEMQNDLFTRIKQKATEYIQRGARAINAKISSAQQKIRNAEREVDRILDDIRWHKRKIEEAKNDCRRAPWYKKYICIGTGFRIAYHGVAIGGLWVGWGIARGVLAGARYFLEGVKAVIKVGANVLSALVNAALSIIDIRYMKFDLMLSGTKRVFKFETHIVVLGWEFRPKITIDFTSSSSANRGIDSAGRTVSERTMDNVEK